MSRLLVSLFGSTFAPKEKPVSALVVLLTLVLVGYSSAQSTSTIPVSGQANIFGAGLSSPPRGGSAPPFAQLQAGPGKVITFPSVTGLVSFGGSFQGADGAPVGSGHPTGVSGTNFTAQGGISGLLDDPGSIFFLVGVFLTDSVPAAPAPLPLMNFSGHENFTELSPGIGQAFFIGDGLTGTRTGDVQKFNVPPTATRLFLGFADGADFRGDPRFYGDNSGTLTVRTASRPGARLVCRAGNSSPLGEPTLTIIPMFPQHGTRLSTPQWFPSAALEWNLTTALFRITGVRLKSEA